jgi:hypothetical protein
MPPAVKHAELAGELAPQTHGLRILRRKTAIGQDLCDKVSNAWFAARRIPALAKMGQGIGQDTDSFPVQALDASRDGLREIAL